MSKKTENRIKIALVVLMVIVLIIVALLGFYGFSNVGYTFCESDFELTLTVSQTEARVGDTITATAKFVNLSGRNLTIRTWRSIRNEPADLILLSNRASDSIWMGRIRSRGINIDPIGRMPRDAIIEREIEFTVTFTQGHVVMAYVSFQIIGFSGDMANMNKQIGISIIG